MSNVPSKQSTLVERLRDNAQGINLGAEGMGWGPADLYAAAADEIERLTRELRLAESARNYANDMLDKARGGPETSSPQTESGVKP